MALLLGMESEKRIDLLIKLTSIRSEPLIRAIKMIYVNGASKKTVNDAAIVTTSNLNRGLDTINAVANVISEIEELDWQRFKSK